MNAVTNNQNRTQDGITRQRVGDGTISCHKNTGYSASADLARIAAARNVAEVKSISHYVEFKMNSVKRSGASTSDIKSTLRQMQKVVGKAKKKVKGLKKEEQLKEQEKLAEKEQKEQLRKRRQQEYQEHKRKRQSRERNDAASPQYSTGSGAEKIAEAAYRKAMEDRYDSHLYGTSETNVVDMAVDDVMTTENCGTVDAAGAVVDMML
jgi:hypothetical protein